MRNLKITEILQFLLLFSLIYGFSSNIMPNMAYGAIGNATVNFSGADITNVGSTLNDGSLGSTDIIGFQLDIFNANRADTGTPVEYFSLANNDSTYNKPVIIPYYDPFTSIAPDLIVIKSNDGSEFSFKSIYVIDYSASEPKIRFEGFRNGISIGAVNLTINDYDYQETFTSSHGLTASIFQNVDEVRISNQYEGDMTWGNYVGINNIEIGDPVDVIAPTVGGGGTITPSNPTSSSVDLSWTAGSDNVTVPANLQYKVVYSTSNNLTTAATAEANGTVAQDWSADLTSQQVTGLSAGTTYYCNVIVKDEAGNKNVYTTATQATTAVPDVTAPTVGGSGTITPSNATSSSVDLSWSAGSDNVTVPANLQYKVVYSTSNNLDTATNAEGNGMVAQDWSADLTSQQVTGLSAGTTYYFNVIVKDEAGNMSVYSTATKTTTVAADVTAPTVGSSGTITPSNPTSSSVDLSWTAGSDNVTVPANLQYKVVYATSNNLDTAINAEANGTMAQDWSVNLTSKQVTGLSASTTYYFNVIVKDEAGNMSVYTTATQATTAAADVTAPTVGGGGTITPSNPTSSSVDLSWTAGSDNVTVPANLQYKVVYSTSNNLDTATNAESNGIVAQTWSANLISKQVTGLSASTTYYFNVIVKDEAGNMSVYTTATQATTAVPDVTAPTVGSSGTITPSNPTSSSVDLSWTAGSDNVTVPANLQYKVVYATSNNLDTAINAEANGTMAQDWSVNLTSKQVTGLSASTTYYFNVIVKDEAGNMSVYTTATQATTAVPDVTAPTVGSSGTITPSSPTSSSVDLNWTAGSDNVTVPANLQYKVVYSTSNNLDTATNAESNGIVAQTWSANLISKQVTGLSASTTYYFNVIVKDEAGNMSVYTTATQATTAAADVTAPTVGGGGTITPSNPTSSSVDLSWTAGSDNVTVPANLQYKVVYSTSNNLDTATNAESNGIVAQTWSANLISKQVTGLSASTTYYFNVIVKDEAGNMSVYTTATQVTTAELDVIAPIVGGSGTLTPSNATSSSVDLSWTAGSDNVTVPANLQYKVVYSTSNNLDTVTNAEANGTVAKDWSASLTSQQVTGLSASTTYYFNVIVKDEAGNMSIYTTATQATTAAADVTVPTVGSGGTITPSNATSSSVDLSWAAGSDNVTVPANLQYKVVYSTSNNIDTATNAETNGIVAQTWSANITSQQVTGLSASTTYYFNIMVRDEAGNKSVYTTATKATTAVPDVIAPTVGGSGTITPSNVTSSRVDLSWTAGSDNVTAPANLQYKVVYSTSNNLDTATNAESNGTVAQTWSANLISKQVTGLSASTTYYFNVIVIDEAGNKSVYTTATVNTGGGDSGGSNSKGGGSTTTPISTSETVKLIDQGTGQAIKEIKAQVIIEKDGTKTVALKATEAMVLKQPDGTTSPVSDLSKLGFLAAANTNSNLTLLANGTIQVKNLENGTESQFTVTYDLGNGQKITIGTIEVKVGSNGDVSLTCTLIDPYGIITDPTTGKPIVGVNVTLYYANTDRNKATGKIMDTIVALPKLDGFKPNNNINPQVSDGSGAYGFMVYPTSDYYIVATKDGYEAYKSPTISVEQEIVKWDFKMNQSIKGVNRLSGLSRVDTALEIAKASYTTKLSDVVLATAENYPDALTGSVLAYKLNAPILLVGSTGNDQEKILAYLETNLEATGTVYILGGTSVVSAEMEAKVIASGFNRITRLGGTDRYETAVKIADQLGVKTGTPIVLVYGENYADALAVSSSAAGMQSPILLVQRDGLSETVKQEIAEIAPTKVYIIGGEGVISATVESQVSQITSLDKANIVRIGGIDRYETSLVVAKYFNLSGQSVCVATGDNFPDALVGSVYAANHNAPIILVDGSLSDQAMNYLQTRKMTGATIFGGAAVVSKEIEQQLEQLLGK